MRNKKEINVEIGQRVKIAREKAKLTQESFSERIDVSPQYISDMERGVVGLSISTLKRICSELSVSSDQLLFGAVTSDLALSFNEKCKKLNAEQISLLMEMIDCFISAVELKKTDDHSDESLIRGST